MNPEIWKSCSFSGCTWTFDPVFGCPEHDRITRNEAIELLDLGELREAARRFAGLVDEWFSERYDPKSAKFQPDFMHKLMEDARLLVDRWA